MPQETCFIPVDVSAGSSPPQARSSGRWKRRKTSKSDTFKCHIYLPDDSDFHHLIPKKATGRELLDYVFWRIDLREKEYFGLKFDNSKGMKVWLDPARKIRKQISKKFLHNSDSSPPCNFYLQVKYFTPEPSSLREEFTRYLFFLHIRRDILEGKLPCSQHHAARLFSYSVQSELGDYDSTRHIPGYTSKFLFMPGQTNDLERAVAEHHKERKGMLQSDAELHFLTYTVLNLEFYGLDSYPVIGHNKENLQLGLAPSGIKIYKDWKMIALFAWGRVLKVAQKRKRLSLVVKSKLGSDGIEEKAIFFELESKILCEVLYDNLVDYLQFYRMRLNVRESRDASRMLAKFRYSTRFMKRDQETYTTSQIIQPPGFRVTTPGLCSNGNHEDTSAVRSVSVNADVEGVFLKSKSIGGYGDRRDHPDLPSLSAIASETQLPFRTINASLPPDIPPKFHTFTPSNGVVGGRRSVSPKAVVSSGKTPIKECEEEVKRPASTPFYKTKQIGSFDSTDSHSNETRSSSATPPSPRYTTLQISRFLSHESPIEVRKFTKDKSDDILTPDNTNGDYSIVKKGPLHYNESNEQRFSLMLDPPEDFANSGQIKQTYSDTMLQGLNTNKQNMIEQYLFSYTANNQTTETKIDSIRPPLPPPPPPPKRISSFCQPESNHNYSNSDLSTSESRDGSKQILLLDEIKQKLEKVKIDKPQRPPPIKPKKRYNLTQVPPNELENAPNLVITNDTNSNSQTSKPQESVERSSQLIASENEQREKAKLNLLEDITHELETRNKLSREPQHQYHNLDITEMRKMSRFTPDIDDTPPPTPPTFNTSPIHKNQHPTRATHSYTTQGLVLSDPNPKTINPKGLGKSKSVDTPLELSSAPKENSFVGLERKRSNTPAPLVEQMALYKQQSLTKTLELQQKSMPSFTVDKNNLNTTFDMPNPVQSLPPKPNIQMSYNQQNRSVPTSMYQQNGTNLYNTPFYPTNSLPKQTYPPQNFAQNPYPNSQPKTMGYRENSSTTPTAFRKTPSPSLSYPNGSNLIQNNQYSMNYNPSHKQGNTVFSSNNNNGQKSYRYIPPIQNCNRQPQTIRLQPASESSITHWV